MIRAMRRMVADVREGKLAEDAIDEAVFASYLDTQGLPDPDLLIRTSGEQRLSNYLLWQLAYSEFYFTEVPWPDFHKKELEEAVEAYNNRDRRFGGVKDV
jgi:undecaprenyl diphosphate synthase